ncbi:hypothetical protein WH47_04711 [Habropoda laboriosa]|uniref:Uncharacterized protein n=1 Tax=Habropoda laboriosa TaxID=597456 RepID=A0A0L7R2W7_9HYME|nr:hypothetical protein WH47_04711 [Habropoda laboriosa]
MSVCFAERKERGKMAHFEKLDEQHPYYVIAAARMWQNPETKPVTTARFYWKFAAFNFIHKRIQESDGGFFENFGTLLAEKVRAQELAEGPLPKKKDEDEKAEEEEEDKLSLEGSIEEPVDALLETDSDRDENEYTANFLAESMGWNIHRRLFSPFPLVLELTARPIRSKSPIFKLAALSEPEKWASEITAHVLKFSYNQCPNLSHTHDKYSPFLSLKPIRPMLAKPRNLYKYMESHCQSQLLLAAVGLVKTMA